MLNFWNDLDAISTLTYWTGLGGVILGFPSLLLLAANFIFSNRKETLTDRQTQEERAVIAAEITKAQEQLRLEKETSQKAHERIGELERNTVNVKPDEIKVGNVTLRRDGLAFGPPTSPTFEQDVKQAVELFNKKQYEEAWRLAEAIAKQNPELGIGRAIMGIASYNLGKIPQCEPELQDALKLNLSPIVRADALFHLGLVAIRKDDSKKAAALLREAIQTNPAHEHAKRLLGELQKKGIE